MKSADTTDPITGPSAPTYTHLYEVVQRRAERYPRAIALGSQAGLTWYTVDSRRLLELVDRTAAELADTGIGAGERVVVWVPETWRSAVYLFALWKLGAIVVPFDREMNPSAAERIVGLVEPKAVLGGFEQSPAWAGDRMLEWWEPGSRLGDRAPEPADWQRPDAEVAAIFFTSGTTGDPKGCTISHRNLCSQIDALRDNIALDESCRLASILPLSHLFELVCGLLYPLASGAAIHYVPSRRGPDIVRVLKDQRITHMNAVPQLLSLMGEAMETRLRERLPGPLLSGLGALAAHLPLRARRLLFFFIHRSLGGRLRMFASGGAALRPETQNLWETVGVRVVQGYGASECSPVIACGVGDGSTPVGSVGRPIRGVRVSLSAAGELLVKGANVMRGYWKDSTQTSEVIRDGWYATGDLASIDADGNIRLQGRAKDLIVLPSGLNVWPEDVEDAFRVDPAVADACVIGVPTAVGGMILHVYLLPTAARGDVAAIVAAGNGRLAQHQRVASGAWWDEPDFPRTSTLKVRRHLLPAPSAGEATEVDSVRASDDPVAQAVAETARLPRVLGAARLGALGFDSLALVDLALRLEEKTGKAVGDGELTLEMTVDQVREHLAAAADLDPSSLRQAEAQTSAHQPLWPYTWGRMFRTLSLPVSVLYHAIVTRTHILGREHLGDLPRRVILAGTHHGYPDMPLVRHALRHGPARSRARRLVVAAGAEGFGRAGLMARYGILAFGLYPLRQYGERDVSLRGLARLAEQGNPVLIFPQGVHAQPAQERAGDDGVRFRPGVSHLAAALDAAVLPFGLAGTDRVMPPTPETSGGRTVAGIPVAFKRGPLAIAFGPAMRLEPDESMPAFAARLQDVCYALTRQAERAIERVDA